MTIKGRKIDSVSSQAFGESPYEVRVDEGKIIRYDSLQRHESDVFSNRELDTDILHNINVIGSHPEEFRERMYNIINRSDIGRREARSNGGQALDMLGSLFMSNKTTALNEKIKEHNYQYGMQARRTLEDYEERREKINNFSLSEAISNRSLRAEEEVGRGQLIGRRPQQNTVMSNKLPGKQFIEKPKYQAKNNNISSLIQKTREKRKEIIPEVKRRIEETKEIFPEKIDFEEI